MIETPFTARWSVRVLLAGLLFFGSEVLLWNDPLGRALTEWLLIVPVYVVLAAVLLDFTARYNVRDLAGILGVAGFYGLANALLINPATTLFDIPRTLVTRALGAHTLLGLEMLVVFLVLTGGHQPHLRRVFIGGAVIVGLAWGTWSRWLAQETGLTLQTPSLETVLLVGMIGIVLNWGLAQFTYRRGAAVTPQAIILTTREWAVMVIVLSIAAFVRLLQNVYTFESLMFTLLLLLLCFAMLWFREKTRQPVLLRDHLPITPLRSGWVIAAVVLLLVSSVFAYSLPLISTSDFNQFTFISLGFSAYGIGWLPLVSLLLGIRAYIRQTQSQLM